MKLTLQLESAKHPRQGDATQPVNRDAGWRLVEDAWGKVNEPGIMPDEQQRRRNWLGGALAVFAEIGRAHV